MRIKLDTNEWGNAALEDKAIAAALQALNSGMGTPSWANMEESHTVECFGIRLAILLDGAMVGEIKPGEEALGTVLLATQPSDTSPGLVFECAGVQIAGTFIPLAAFETITRGQSHAPRLAQYAKTLLEENTKLSDQLEKAHAEIARLVDVAAVQQGEHDEELESTRKQLRDVQEKLRDARRRLAAVQG